MRLIGLKQGPNSFAHGGEGAHFTYTGVECVRDAWDHFIGCALSEKKTGAAEVANMPDSLSAVFKLFFDEQLSVLCSLVFIP